MSEAAPRRREPAFNIPAVVVAVCAVLLVLHVVRLALSAETDNALVALTAFVPARVTLALAPTLPALAQSYQDIVAHNPIAAAQIRFLLGDGALRPWTVLTYALLHAGWAHVGFNCIWLVAFGSAVARRFSTLAFLALLVVSAIAGALVQWIADITSFQLVIGASAAVSGAMGAAVRFVFRPEGEPRQIFDRRTLDEAFRRPALSLRETFANRTALIFVALWFGTNLIFGLFPSLSGIGDGAIAWQAHIGGFLVGLLAFPAFDRRRPALPDIEREDTADLGSGPPA